MEVTVKIYHTYVSLKNINVNDVCSYCNRGMNSQLDGSGVWISFCSVVVLKRTGAKEGQTTRCGHKSCLGHYVAEEKLKTENLGGVFKIEFEQFSPHSDYKE